MISDRFIIELDTALRTLFAPATSVREVPGSQEPEPALSRPERAHASALMRINHVGEVCAQALYQRHPPLHHHQADRPAGWLPVHPHSDRSVRCL